MRFGRWIFFAAVSGMVVATALEGCSDGGSTTQGDVCLSGPVCPKATPSTPTEQQQCQTFMADPKCGAAYKAMKECMVIKAQCTSTGSFSSSATNSVCRTEINNYNACNTGNDGGVDACRPRTCSQLGKNCGQVDNGCGTMIECGTCTNGQTCGGGGANRCGCSCDPSWCGTLSACGTTITCPTNCVAPQFCGGGGIANRCGCTPAGSNGPLSASSVTTAVIPLEAGSSTSWSSATNARGSDNSYASATLGPNITTQYLVALSYNVALPATATVEGISVQVERLSSAGLATADHAVHLVKNTQILSSADNKAVLGAVWPVTETTVTYGGPTDKWGSTWTAAEINAGGFGVAFAATYTGGVGSEQARVDAIRVTVHYSGVSCN